MTQTVKAAALMLAMTMAGMAQSPGQALAAPQDQKQTKQERKEAARKRKAEEKKRQAELGVRCTRLHRKS